MHRPLRIEEQLWVEEASAALDGDERWTCLTATIAAGGSRRLAVYRMRLTGARRTVSLAAESTTSAGERRAEIRRRLGMGDITVPESRPHRNPASAGLLSAGRVRAPRFARQGRTG